MAARYVPNPYAIPEIARLPKVLEACDEAAKLIAEQAKSAAPVEDGDYRDSIGTDAGVDGTAQAHVYAKDYKSGWIEFGTSQRGPYAPLRRGAERAGFIVKGGDDDE